MAMKFSRDALAGTLAFLGLGTMVFLGLSMMSRMAMPRAAAGPDVVAPAKAPNVPFPIPPELEGLDLNKQSDEEIKAKSNNCIACHENSKDPHCKSTVRLGCTDCHGGNPNITRNDDGTGFPERDANAARSCPAGLFRTGAAGPDRE